MFNFLIIGAAGYIAKKHIDVIYKTKNNLSVIIDTSESVGYVDKYFPNTLYFKTLKKYDFYLKKNKSLKIDYFVICTPNYLHFEHIKYAASKKYKIISEKPLTININYLNRLINLEKKGIAINTILQLRHNKKLKKLKNKLKKDKIYDIDLVYITPRGDWYNKSWKGNKKKSGGIAFNLGIHFVDILLWLFGNILEINIFYKNKHTMFGNFKFKNASVNWLLSHNIELIHNFKNVKYYRKIKINNTYIDLSDNFDDLHFKAYKEIIKNKGIKVKQVEDSILITNEISKMKSNNKNINIINHFLKKL